MFTSPRRNIIDATPVEAAQSGPGTGADGQPKRDKDAGWHVKADSRGTLKSTYGYSVHTGVPSHGLQGQTTARQWTKMASSTDKPSPLATPALSDCSTITCRATHDSTERDTFLLGDEAALYADAAYSSGATRAKLERFGIKDRVQRKGYRGHPISEADKARNAEIAVTRSGGEHPFATYKSRYGLARTRLMGLANNLTFYGLAAVAHNIQKAAKFLLLYGLPEPELQDKCA